MIKGHSKTPLLKKLGIKDHMCLILWNEPIWFREMLVAEHSNLKFLSRANQESADFIQIFIKSKSQLVLHLEKYKKGMRKHGMLWVAWPKGKSGIETD